MISNPTRAHARTDDPRNRMCNDEESLSTKHRGGMRRHRDRIRTSCSPVHRLPHDTTLVPMGYSRARFLNALFVGTSPLPKSYARGLTRRLRATESGAAGGVRMDGNWAVLQHQAKAAWSPKPHKDAAGPESPASTTSTTSTMTSTTASGSPGARRRHRRRAPRPRTLAKSASGVLRWTPSKVASTPERAAKRPLEFTDGDGFNRTNVGHSPSPDNGVLKRAEALDLLRTAITTPTVRRTINAAAMAAASDMLLAPMDKAKGPGRPVVVPGFLAAG